MCASAAEVTPRLPGGAERRVRKMSRLLGLGAEEVGLGRERSGRGGAGAFAGWAAGAREETAAATAGPRERVKAEVGFWARREDGAGRGKG